MGVQSGKLLHRTHLQPLGQLMGTARVEGMQGHHRQGKIVDIIVMVGNLELDRIVFMDFWQELCPCSSRHVTDLVQEVPYFRLYKEIIGI